MNYIVRKLCTFLLNIYYQNNVITNIFAAGMNLYDFFNFMVRFSFANIVQLFHLSGGNVLSKWCSSSKARQLIFNLESAKDIATKMKFACLSDNYNISLDFRRILKEPTFLELCFQLERTYGFIHNHQHTDIDDLKKYLMDDLVDSGFSTLNSTVVSNPRNLAILIDDTLQNLKILPQKKSS